MVMNTLGKILLVDDDQEFRSEFGDCFEEYDIIEASNGEEALKILKKPNEIDLVILDVRMPGMDGIEVLGKIKKMMPEVGIIIFTGYGSKDVVVEALRKQADDYLEKPFDIDKTRRIIEKVLDTKRGGTEYDAIDTKGIMERVMRFAERNWAKRVSLQDAADAVYLSPKYLSRLFKENTGMGFSEYKLKVKIKKAQELLRKTGYTIDQISYKIGYQNSESFIRIFKKLTRYTPTEYRKKSK